MYESIGAKIDRIANVYKVPDNIIYDIVKRESGFNPKAVGDVNYVCPKTGKIAPSWGLVQISSCWHDIAKEQAEDPDFALNFLAKNLALGKCKMWSTCPKSL